MARYIDADVFEQRLEDKDIFFPALYKIELNSTPTADVVPKSEVANMLSDLKKEIHDKAVYPNNSGVEPYISVKVFDAVLQGYVNKFDDHRR